MDQSEVMDENVTKKEALKFAYFYHKCRRSENLDDASDRLLWKICFPDKIGSTMDTSEALYFLCNNRDFIDD